MGRATLVVRLGASIAAVGLVTFVLFQFDVNQTTVALSYVVVILSVATRWGIAEATTASIAAMLLLNFFFLPPIGTLTIAHPENWVALIVFLATGLVASQLSGRARARTVEAIGKQRDLERLYALSRALLLSGDGSTIPETLAQRIAEAFDLPAVALYDERADRIVLGGQVEFADIEAKLRQVARQATSVVETDGTVIVAIRLGGSPIGSLALSGGRLTDTVLQSVANLAAIGLERARAQEAAASVQAARQSGELRAAVLDALAHEFKTPLTSLKVAAEQLSLSEAVRSARDQELVSIITEDLERLQQLVTDAVRMVRIDAGDFVVRPEHVRLAPIVDAAIRSVRHRVQGRAIVMGVPADLEIEADPALLSLVLRELLDNALKYSAAGSEVGVTARGTDPVEILVTNGGVAIPPREQQRVFDRFFRGAHAARLPGTGLGLAIVRQIVLAHGGTAAVSSPPGGPTVFTLTFPRSAGVP
jgi:two-component system, OmpR family, sensor histidine kinase KdpD